MWLDLDREINVVRGKVEMACAVNYRSATIIIITIVVKTDPNVKNIQSTPPNTPASAPKISPDASVKLALVPRK